MMIRRKKPANPTAHMERKAGSAWVEGKVRWFTEYRIVKKRRKRPYGSEHYVVKIKIPLELGRKIWRTVEMKAIRSWPQE